MVIVIDRLIIELLRSSCRPSVGRPRRTHLSAIQGHISNWSDALRVHFRYARVSLGQTRVTHRHRPALIFVHKPRGRRTRDLASPWSFHGRKCETRGARYRRVRVRSSGGKSQSIHSRSNVVNKLYSPASGVFFSVLTKAEPDKQFHLHSISMYSFVDLISVSS